MNSIAQQGTRGIRFTLLAATLTGALSGCTVGPNFEKPNPSLPEKWIAPTTAPTTQQSIVAAEPVNLTKWWTTLNDPALNDLIERAIASNLDLKQAAARVRQSRAQRGVARSTLFPSADASGGYQRSGDKDTSSGLFRAGVDASWELDFFGGNRRSVEAADADITSSIEDQRDVLITLVSEVAFSYIDLRGFQQEIEVARNNLRTQRRTADLTRQLQGAGFVGSLDTANAESTVASTEAAIPLLEQDARQTIYSLSVLLALEPAALIEQLDKYTAVPQAPQRIPVGLPSDLLLRRPDIRRAEADLHAAVARVGVAQADLYPRFTLTGDIGTAGRSLGSLVDTDNLSWSIGPGIRWPIFSAGRIRANIASQQAFVDQVQTSYQRTILNALRDVESALIAYEKEQQHRAALVRAVEANRRALDISTQLYTNGNTDFLNVLNAQRSLLGSEDALVRSDRTIATNLIALYKALGGGWDVEEESAK
jgi:NodT family efflux transporter outer membrane factor (OMF) lipoprotein